MANPRLSPWASVRLPWLRFQQPSQKFRTVGFPQYGFEHQAPCSSDASLPDAVDSLSPIPTSPATTPVCSCLRVSPPPNGNSATECGAGADGGPTWALRSSLRLGYAGPALYAYRPHPPVWCPPSHFPAVPVIGSVFGIPGSSCLGPRPSELSLSHCARLPPSTSAGSPVRACPHLFRTDTGHRREGRKSWHSNTPLKSVSCGILFRRFVRSLWLRPSCSFAPWTDPTETVRSPPGRLGLLLPGFQALGLPRDCRV